MKKTQQGQGRFILGRPLRTFGRGGEEEQDQSQACVVVSTPCPFLCQVVKLDFSSYRTGRGIRKKMRNPSGLVRVIVAARPGLTRGCQDEAQLYLNSLYSCAMPTDTCAGSTLGEGQVREHAHGYSV